MKRSKYTESNVPDNLIVKVHYFKDKRWSTFATLIDKATDEVVAAGTAVCAEVEQPVRKIGRAIAVGRALKYYHTGAY